MSRINIRAKGQAGEIEVCKLIQAATGIEMKRNLQQTQDGGYDLIGITGLAIEVKRGQTLAIPAWWRQTIAQAAPNNDIPVLAYRQNRKPWKFIVGVGKVEMDKDEFVGWIKVYVSNSVTGA